MFCIKHIWQQKPSYDTDFKILDRADKDMRIGKFDIRIKLWKLDDGFAGFGFWLKNQLFYTHIWELDLYLLMVQISIFVMDMQELPQQRI